MKQLQQLERQRAVAIRAPVMPLPGIDCGVFTGGGGIVTCSPPAKMASFALGVSRFESALGLDNLFGLTGECTKYLLRYCYSWRLTVTACTITATTTCAFPQADKLLQTETQHRAVWIMAPS